MDEFQAFVTRVKQLHMSRSADADCDEPLRHDKAKRRLCDNAESSVETVDDNAASGDMSLKPSQSPLVAKSLDDQRLRRSDDLFESPIDDIDMEDDKEDEKVAEVPAVVVENESKEVKKNIQVMVGIDEDLKMILEMDPEIVDLGGLEKPAAEPKVMGLPPLSGR